MKINIHNILTLCVLSCFISGISYSRGFCQTKNDPDLVLEKIVKILSNELIAIEKRLSVAAEEVSKEGFTGKEVRKILYLLTERAYGVIDCAVVDRKGVLVTVEPRKYYSQEGKNISKQEHIKEVFNSKQAVFSKLFHSREGINAFDLAYPIYSAKNGLIGIVSMLINPETMFSNIILPIIRDSAVEVWVMQKDGMLLYCRNTEQIGKNIFNDKLDRRFISFLPLGKKIAEKKKGKYSYEVKTEAAKNKVTRDVFWDTVSINGLEWRIVLKERDLQ